jgi:thiopurine S-methyltransferase
MEASFWHERWATQQTAFHLDHPNPLLLKHAAVLGAPGRVLVPLCGKAHDLAWLAAQGHEVVGVELSELAARAFFAEQQLTATESVLGPYKRFAAGAIEILCGDFFALERSHLLGPSGRAITAVYDRAALIALPAPMRERYAQQLSALLPAGSALLLITFEHVGSGDSGPPFSVPSSEVHALYDGTLAISELERNDVLAIEPRFKARGITALFEVAYALRRL